MYNDIRNLNSVRGADWKINFVVLANQKLTKRFHKRERHSPAENRDINITIRLQHSLTLRDYIRGSMIRCFVVTISELQEPRIFFALRHRMQWIFFYDCLCDTLGRFTATLVATSFASNQNIEPRCKFQWALRSKKEEARS